METIIWKIISYWAFILYRILYTLWARNSSNTNGKINILKIDKWKVCKYSEKVLDDAQNKIIVKMFEILITCKMCWLHRNVDKYF